MRGVDLDSGYRAQEGTMILEALAWLLGVVVEFLIEVVFEGILDLICRPFSWLARRMGW